MDSIRENQEFEDMVTTLKLELDADVDGHTSFVLVEGSDDVTFVGRIFEEHVVCYESFSGKEGLRWLLEAEELQDERIIGIRDRDYANVIDFPERMFCYDTCCLETMILQNEDVREGLCRTYYKGSKNRSTLILEAMRQLAPLSVLRQENEWNGWGIDFKRGSRLGECIDEERWDINQQQLFRKLNQSFMGMEDCQQMVANWSEEILYEKTNGHDICRFLGKILKSGKGDLGEARVRDILICSYRSSDFRDTDLYIHLKDYQRGRQLRYVE